MARSLPDLPRVEYVMAAMERDREVDRILAGRQTAGSRLRAAVDPEPEVGDLAYVARMNGDPAALIRRTEVEVCRLSEVGPEHVAAETGDEEPDVEQWRRSRVEVWSRQAKLDSDPVDAREVEVVLERFEVVATLRGGAISGVAMTAMALVGVLVLVVGWLLFFGYDDYGDCRAVVDSWSADDYAHCNEDAVLRLGWAVVALVPMTLLTAVATGGLLAARQRDAEDRATVERHLLQGRQ